MPGAAALQRNLDISSCPKIKHAMLLLETVLQHLSMCPWCVQLRVGDQKSLLSLCKAIVISPKA